MAPYIRPEVRHLVHFIAAAEELHFTRAAERLNLTQQSLSTSIAQLETILGVTLLERSTRQVRLTAAGETFLDHARVALAAVDDAARTARMFAEGERGAIVLGLSSTSGLPFTPRLLEALRERYPDLRVDVRHYGFRDPSAGLADRSSDVAIVRPPLAAPGLDAVELAAERRWVALPAGHPLAARDGVRFAEIEHEPWMDVDTDEAWCAFWRCDDQRSGPARIGAVCESLDDLFEAARSGAALGLVPESVATSRAWPGLALVPVVDIPPTTAVLAVRADDPRPAVRNVLATATDTA